MEKKRVSFSQYYRPPFHIQQNKQIYIMLRITNSTLMDRILPKALADIKI